MGGMGATPLILVFAAHGADSFARLLTEGFHRIFQKDFLTNIVCDVNHSVLSNGVHHIHFFEKRRVIRSKAPAADQLHPTADGKMDRDPPLLKENMIGDLQG